ncbi:MAG: endonuclease/exonuclease/phosphatase family protein [Bacteroidota bacterium]|nr:endonuclease/exonuclease/phosphatase family protein [Bacteroidota bacterium]
MNRSIIKTGIPVIMIIIIFMISGCVQQSKSPEQYSIVFYNVENLFDTIDNPEKNDERYLPGSDLDWNTEKYMHKLNQLGKVLTSIHENSLPSIIGLSEVENRLVLEDLIELTDLKKGNYQIIHQEGPDERGIDMALLYRESMFKPIDIQFIPINYPFNPEEKTRNILYVRGEIMDELIHLYINHWTSRWGGHLETNPHRAYTAEFLRSHIDAVLDTDPEANIIAMGDLNDNPTDTSVYMILQAFPLTMDIYDNELYNLTLEKYEKGVGTLYWKDWDMFDQIIVNGNFLKRINLEENELVYKREWMLYERQDGIKVPSRTASKSYYGGFSDHLPVYLVVRAK